MNNFELNNQFESFKNTFNGIAVTLDGKLKDTKKEVAEMLRNNTQEVFKNVVLSKELKAYSKMLLELEVIKDIQLDIIKSATSKYNTLDILTFEEKEALGVYHNHVVKVANITINNKFKELKKVIEKNVTSHLKNNDYVLVGTDFTTVSKFLKVRLDSSNENTMKEFDSLVLTIFKANLSNKLVEAIKNEILWNVKETYKNDCLTTEQIEKADTNLMMHFLEKADVKFKAKNITEKFLSQEGKAYVEITKEVQTALEKINNQ